MYEYAVLVLLAHYDSTSKQIHYRRCDAERPVVIGTKVILHGTQLRLDTVTILPPLNSTLSGIREIE
jgi:hypothetical protein